MVHPFIHIYAYMKVIKYNKLIRDKIPEIIKKDKAIPKVTRLNSKSFEKELKKKLIEESMELQIAQGKKDILKELSDVLEILQAIARIENISWKKIEEQRRERAKKRGGFKKKLFLKEVQEQY